MFGYTDRKQGHGTSNDDSNNRRKHARIKVSVPVEIQTDASDSPMRGATADLKA